MGTQKLWYQTAGKRPKQPEAERKYFEKLWQENLKQSSAPNVAGVNDYQQDVRTAAIRSDEERPTDDNNNNNNHGTVNIENRMLSHPFSNAVTKVVVAS